MRIVHDTETIRGIDASWSFHLAPAPSGRIFVLCCSMLAGLIGQPPKRTQTPRSAAHRVAPRKSRGDFLAKGHAWIDPRRTGRDNAVAVAIELNDFRKELVVLGDRHWAVHGIGTRATDPLPFEKVPLTYEYAFGGPGYAWNPQGRGHGLAPNGIRLPNIVHASHPVPRAIDQPVPAGFGPLDVTWLPRAARLGTYDQAWLKNRWPALPRDFDPAHWNEAPEDQRFSQHFRGDERLAFDNMHPRHTRLEATLPGLRGRAFLATSDGGLRELTMQLDTIDADLDAEQLELVWRGAVAVRSPRLRGIDFLFTMIEPLDANTDAAVCLARFEAARRRRYPTPEEAEAARASVRAVEEKATEDKLGALADGFRQAAAQASEATREPRTPQAAQQSPVSREATTASPGAPSRRNAEIIDPAQALREAQGRTLERDPAQVARSRAMMDDLGVTIPAQPTLPSFSNERIKPVWTRERVVAAHAAGTNLAGADLTGVDLSVLNLSGAKFANAAMVGVDLTGTILSDADLTGARLSGSKVTGACFERTRLSRTSFAGLDCSRLSFQGAVGDNADFSGSTLAGSDFTQARLPRSDFSAARLDDAVFDGASLASAMFAEAKGQRVSFAGCDLTNVRAMGAALPGASCVRAKAPNSVWQKAGLRGADFSRAVLTRANFAEAELSEAKFDRAWMDDANLDDAILVRAVMTNARLPRISLERADLTDADLSSSNLYRAGFFEARAERARFDGSLLRGTLLST